MMFNQKKNWPFVYILAISIHNQIDDDDDDEIYGQNSFHFILFYCVCVWVVQFSCEFDDDDDGDSYFYKTCGIKYTG